MQSMPAPLATNNIPRLNLKPSISTVIEPKVPALVEQTPISTSKVAPEAQEKEKKADADTD